MGAGVSCRPDHPHWLRGLGALGRLDLHLEPVKLPGTPHNLSLVFDGTSRRRHYGYS